MAVNFRVFRPLSLADLVEVIGDWNIPDGDTAKSLTIKHPPGPRLFLVARYGAPFRTDWQFGSSSRVRSDYALAVTQIRTGFISVRPNGPFGVLIACLKPEAAVRLLGIPMQAFADTEISLRDLFDTGDISLLEEMLAGAQDSRERVAAVEALLLRRARRTAPDSLACQAAILLRSDPSLPVRSLASRLDISERHLLRSFEAVFGTNPKQFARLVRIEKLLAARREGSSWAQAAYNCGFKDQPHMISDFKSIVGQSPGDFFSTSSKVKLYPLSRGFGVTYAISQPCNP
jgi:AraC-like DNA-binding protein